MPKPAEADARWHPDTQAKPQALLAVLLHVNLQDVIGATQQQQRLQAKGVRVAQPLPQ